ncbi:MAG: hypothetical protein ABFS56_32840, partial [Pseudomonadota bacterium]
MNRYQKTNNDARAAFRERQKAEGLVERNIIFDPETFERLERLRFHFSYKATEGRTLALKQALKLLEVALEPES